MGSSNRSISHLFSAVIIALGAAVTAVSVYGFSAVSIEPSFLIFAASMIGLSAVLKLSSTSARIQPIVALVVFFFAFYEYGAAASVVFAVFEGLISALNQGLRSDNGGARTVALKTSVAGLCAFIATFATNSLLTPRDIFSPEQSAIALVATLASVALAHFVVSVCLITAFAAVRDAKIMGAVLLDYILTNSPAYVAAVIIAGAAAFALDQVSGVLFGMAGLAILALFFTYRPLGSENPKQDVEETSGHEDVGAFERAQAAEKEVDELHKVVAQQEQAVAALKESKEKFRHAAFHDPLTDLPNRNLFVESLRFQFEKSRTTRDFRFAVMFLDLDRFKMINDSLGHSLGDRLIWHVGRRLAKIASENDLVARFSGDEFALLIPGNNDPSDLMNLAQLIRHKLSAPFSLNGRQVFTTASIGIALGGPVYGEAEEILRDADIAMYYAKEHGNGVEIFDSAMHTKAVRALQLETDLRHAAERNELVAYYQPIVDLATMRLTGFESLVRWNHPHRGLIPPLDFIPLAEETGMIIPLTMWMLKESCTQLANWQARSPLNKSLMMSINLSGKHFSDPNIVEGVRRILHETGVPAASLKLEITESAVMENADAAIAVLKQLRDLGCQLSIDDFGTGYSSLSYLHRFPIDMLKVDRSFVSTMEDGTENGEIVRTIIALSKTLGLSVVAEGIESIHQLHQLRILGCEYGQGFLFARPVPTEEATALLDDRMRWQNIIPDNNPAVVAQNREFSQLRIMK